jgi:glycosyltransferase involved in cell wall biosynthesis
LVQRRILLLITDLRIGGTPTVVRELATRLAGDPNFNVQVACLDGWGPVVDQLRTRGIAVTRLDARSRFDLRVVPRLVGLIRQERIDTVFSFLVHANAVAAAAKKFVRGVRFFQSIQTAQAKPRWHWKVQAAVQGAAEKIIVPSQSVAEAAARWARAPEDRILVIPNAVDVDAFANSPREGNGKQIGFIGRLDPIKLVEDLVTAVSLLPLEFTLEIFGEGPERERIESAISRLGLEERVVLRGEIAGPAEALREIDVLVLPSEAEGFGLVLIEAMAAGVPVIGTNVPGIREVIEDGVSGVLTPVGNPPALADAIKRILGDGDLAQRLVAGGRARVRERYDWSVQIEAYRKLLA